MGSAWDLPPMSPDIFSFSHLPQCPPVQGVPQINYASLKKVISLSLLNCVLLFTAPQFGWIPQLFLKKMKLLFFTHFLHTT